jgi:hypothetical protein
MSTVDTPKQIQQVFEKLKKLGVVTDQDSTEAVAVTGQLKQRPGHPMLSVPLPLRPIEQDPAKDRRVRNREIGEANRQFYVEQSAKTGKAWHTHVKQNDQQYSEWVIINPAMAQTVLDNFNADKDFGQNRKQKLKAADAYARDILNDRWIDTGESIEIDYNNILYNGQHRLLGVTKAGKSALFWVTFNCLPEARFGIDQGVPRSTREKIDLVMENKVGASLPAVARAMMRGFADSTKFSNPEVVLFCQQYGPIIEWVVRSTKRPGTRCDVRAAIAKAALWYGIEVVEPFCEKWSKMIFESESCPVQRLYRFLHETKLRRKRSSGAMTTYKRSVSAITAFVDGRPIRSLVESSRDIFEWERNNGNWIVPNKD